MVPLDFGALCTPSVLGVHHQRQLGSHRQSCADARPVLTTMSQRRHTDFNIRASRHNGPHYPTPTPTGENIQFVRRRLQAATAKPVCKAAKRCWQGPSRNGSVPSAKNGDASTASFVNREVPQATTHTGPCTTPHSDFSPATASPSTEHLQVRPTDVPIFTNPHSNDHARPYGAVSFKRLVLQSAPHTRRPT